jgi:polyhydroxybutyrate depolymerase
MEPAPLMTSNRTRVAGALVFFLGLPVVLVAAEAVRYHVANRSTSTLLSGGKKREYILHVPGSYNHRPTPLVISMHGAGLWAAGQRAVSGLDHVADREGFIVVYPSGITDSGPIIWNVDGSGRLAADVAFISELIDTIQAEYNIDPTRIYANGLSNGGGMSFVLSCVMSDRIAAVALVASAQTLPWSWCTARTPVPMIAFHGTADRATPLNGGVSFISKRGFPSIIRWAANWARRNQCSNAPVDSVVAHDVTRTLYSGCANNADVALHVLRDGGHTWPGGRMLPEYLGRTSDFDANSVMWDFFEQHPRGGPQPPDVRGRIRCRAGCTDPLPPGSGH